MKKIILLALAACSVFKSDAQVTTDTQPSPKVSADSQKTTQVEAPPRLKNKDELLPKFCIDINYKYGILEQQMTMINLNKSYTRSVNTSIIPNLKFTEGRSISGDLTFGYFFGKQHIIGIGTGIIYQNHTGNISMDTFHAEYQSLDIRQDTFRQLITTTNSDSKNPKTDNIKENVTVTNISIPILFKLKHQFPKSNFGVSADVGGLLGIYNETHYNSNAVFNYEAIYSPYSENAPHYTYDNSPIANPNDLIITKKYMQSVNPARWETEFAQYVNDKYSVALNKAPTKNSGRTSYNALSYGFLAQAGISYYISYRITFILGGYFSYQVFSNSGNDNYRITDKPGDYSSIINGIKDNVVTSYGLNAGLRFFIGKDRDLDGDGTPDKKDECPYSIGAKINHGCPDTDGDGIRDIDDQCPLDPGPLCANGCPDRDNDCVPDDIDRCKDIPGIAEYYGCKDSTSYLKSFTTPVSYAGEPVIQYIYTEGTHHIMLSNSVINFKTGKSQIEESDFHILNEAIDSLNANEKVVIFISGHTDDVGSFATNQALSYARADAVRRYLLNKGLSRKRIIISGNSNEDPIIDNDSPENRARNRRIEMRMLLPLDRK